MGTSNAERVRLFYEKHGYDSVNRKAKIARRAAAWMRVHQPDALAEITRQVDSESTRDSHSSGSSSP